MAHGIATEADIKSIRDATEAEIAAGIEFARNGTDPDPTEVTRDVYSPEAA
jgi:pyruvate dehydrogenase E1 component alpha subunit